MYFATESRGWRSKEFTVKTVKDFKSKEDFRIKVAIYKVHRATESKDGKSEEIDFIAFITYQL